MFKSLRNAFSQSDVSREIADLEQATLVLCKNLSSIFCDTYVDANNEQKELTEIYVGLVLACLAMEYIGYLTLDDRAAALHSKIAEQTGPRFRDHFEKQLSDFLGTGDAEPRNYFVQDKMVKTLTSLHDGSLRFFPLDGNPSDKDAILVRAARIVAAECGHAGDYLVEGRLVVSLIKSLAPIKYQMSVIAAKIGIAIP